MTTYFVRAPSLNSNRYFALKIKKINPSFYTVPRNDYTSLKSAN